MSEIQKIKDGQAEVLNIFGPTTNDGASVLGATGKVYILDQRFDDSLVDNHSVAAATTLKIHDASEWIGGGPGDGMEVLFRQGDGALHGSVVSSVNTTTNELTLATAFTANTGSGARVWRTFDSTGLVMVEFGTGKVPYDQSGEWGYRVTLEITYGSGIYFPVQEGQRIWVLYTLTDGVNTEFERLDPAIVV